jgi:acyl-CoA synthetase (AMP-forming)/AMP-acid ligase II
MTTHGLRVDSVGDKASRAGFILLDQPIRRATLGDQLRRNAARFPNKEAIIIPSQPGDGVRRSLTYSELNAAVNRFASNLASRGVVRGDVIAIMGRNCAELLVVFWAAMKLGVTMTGVNYTFKEKEITYQISHSRAKVLVVEDQFVSRIESLASELVDVSLRIVNDAFDNTAPTSWERLSQMIIQGEDIEPSVLVDEETIAILPYTSGTTALPKAVAVPHRNYISSMVPSWTTGIGLIEEDVWYDTVPLHTIAGMGLQIATMCLANTIILPPQVSAPHVLDVLVNERVTILIQTPTFFLQVIQTSGFERADLSHLRRCITYGGTMPPAILKAFTDASPNMEWVTLWSQSELSQTPTIGRFRSLDDVPGRDLTWIGRPTAQLEVRVVDEEDVDCSEGELICRSPGVMAGYFQDPERTERAIRNGWLYTGDLVRCDDSGNLFFVDRKNDVIKSGGMNVSSVEVERICYQFPEILEIAVVGLADEYWSQAVTAFVVPKPGETVDADELIKFCKSQLAGYKVPKAIHLVDALPKDSQGKILKRELRRKYEVSVNGNPSELETKG